MANEINADVDKVQESIQSDIEVKNEPQANLQENEVIDASVGENEQIDTSVEQGKNEISIELQVSKSIEPSTNDYNRLINKPQINSVELIGNKSLDELDIQVKGDYPDEALTNNEIEELLNNFV